MDNLYQSPPYAYLPQQNTSVDNYPTTMFRPTFDRPSLYMDNHHHNDIDSYNNNNGDWSHHHHHSPYGSYYGSNTNNNISSPRPKITTNLWEDEGTLCFQVDAKGICVARRQDNDMINGTKLLNVVGMSRGKRDGILKNEKGRVVVKVGAMHLKGVWIPFARATELAEKFKILDVLYPLFVDEPSVYLSTNNAAHHEVIPSPVNNNTKCNMSSPLPFTSNHRSSIDDYNHTTHWDNRPYSLMNHHHHHPSSPYDPSPPPQILHRNSNPDLASAASPIPRSVQQDENDLYLLNNNSNNDYYNNRPFNNNNNNNRGSFSSVSSHHSYLYPSLHHEDDTSKTTTSSVTTPTSYLDNHNNNSSYQYGSGRPYNNTITSPPYIKTSPYTTIPALSNVMSAHTNSSILDDINNTTTQVTTTTSENRHSSAGSTTPSSWFSPETPTAVLFQQVNKEDLNKTSKKRKASTTIESGLIKTLKKSTVSPTTSPHMRATSHKDN